ncbi:CTTNBP2 N-terminal-like protein isoform X3 [Harmonia axyridis]|uniref:CTTNBP2 N-terminal-like protein isoform X3 n=1 Tax=Harmonia axyridis TaxID=115357 RepID=UPI001E277F70|nr:CTTNBP2 N-terminal-like protein isoform X3 [Harmonia axyridis]
MNKGLHKNKLNMATNNNQNGWISGLSYGAPLSAVQEQQPGTSPEMNQYEQLDRPNTGCNTLKRNPKMELSKTDLLKLVTYFEGEIQARDIVIAALKSEKLKQIVNLGRYKPAVMNDPYTALLRDSIADGPNVKPPTNEKDMTTAAEQQLQALEQLALQQRRAHQHMINILKEAEAKHKKVIQELEEEKCKHEHDTAQGDDITYGLEMERTRLRQELEMERNGRKKLEKELKRQLEMADEERARQKQIVLLLLAERKKIIVKYIEERKRSEDLAQILSEEKSRNDTMAEGLEEESKKSLQMEAELEKQGHVFEADKKSLKSQLALKEARCVELEAEIQKLKAECEAIRNRTNVPCDTASAVSSIAKAVQPTATVSSFPVSGPSKSEEVLLSTGIAQSVVPGQVIRQTAVAPVSKLVTPSPTSSVTSQGTVSRAPGKLGFQYQSNAPQTPPKKGSLAARGVPPPIPPNKPVIPIKQTTPRRLESAADIEKKKATVPAKEDHNDRSSEKSQMG